MEKKYNKHKPTLRGRILAKLKEKANQVVPISELRDDYTEDLPECLKESKIKTTKNAISNLRKEGFKIKAVSRKGYCLLL